MKVALERQRLAQRERGCRACEFFWPATCGTQQMWRRVDQRPMALAAENDELRIECAYLVELG